MWLAVLVAIPALPGTAMAQAAGAPQTAAQALSPRLLADASWHGRPIQRPFARRTRCERQRGAPAARHRLQPAGRIATGPRRAAPTHPAGLPARPAATGCIGPRTQAAVLAFQRKHGLERTGSVGTGTLRIMRRRTAPAAEPPAPAERPQQTQTRPPQTQTQPPIAPAQATDDGVPSIATVLLLALAIPLVLLVGMLARGRRRQAVLERPAEQLALPAFHPPYEPWMPEPQDQQLVPEPKQQPRVHRVTPAAAHPLTGAPLRLARADPGHARGRHDPAGDRRSAHRGGGGHARRLQAMAAVERRAQPPARSTRAGATSPTTEHERG